jgi:hypothetical protein
MANRNTRWLVLTIFAVANLVCWAGAAAAVGLVVSPTLDLGLETLIREGQATAAAMWERLDQPSSNPTTMPEEADPFPMPAKTGTAGDEPIAAVISTENAAPANTPQPDSTRTAADSGAVSDSQPTAQPDATLVSSPLLLADPEFNNLALLDAEMARSAPQRAVQIRYQEATLNAEIAALWRNNPDLPFREVWVDLMRDQVVVTGKMTVLGFQVNGEVTGQVAVEDCVPVLEIEQVRIAGVMTPSFVRDQVENMVLEAMTWYPADYPLCLEQIVLEETRATVYGYRR